LSHCVRRSKTLDAFLPSFLVSSAGSWPQDLLRRPLAPPLRGLSFFPTIGLTGGPPVSAAGQAPPFLVQRVSRPLPASFSRSVLEFFPFWVRVGIEKLRCLCRADRFLGIHHVPLCRQGVGRGLPLRDFNLECFRLVALIILPLKIVTLPVGASVSRVEFPRYPGPTGF